MFGDILIHSFNDTKKQKIKKKLNSNEPLIIIKKTIGINTIELITLVNNSLLINVPIFSFN